MLPLWTLLTPALVLAPAQPARAQTPAALDLPASLGEFAQALNDFRDGDDSIAPTLHALAAGLCARWRRCDAVAVANFYATLAREERLAGRSAELELATLREAVYEAGVQGLRGEAWTREGTRLVEALDTLALREAARADFTPAAGASSLAALLEAQHLEGEARVEPGDERLGRAAERARNALELFERAGQRTPQLEPLWVLARLALVAGERAAARARFAQCEALAREVGRDDYREHALAGFIELARVEGDVGAQEAALIELASFRSPAQSWPVARDWAARLLSDDHAAEAVEFLERYAPGAAAHVADRDEWELLLGSARLRAGDSGGAREHFERVAQGAGGELALLCLASLALYEGREFEALDLLGAPERLALFSPVGRTRAAALLGEACARTQQLELAREHLERACDDALVWERDALRERALASPLTQAAASVVGERLGLHSVTLLADVLARSGASLEAARACEDWQSRSLRAGAPLASEDLQAWARSFELGLVTWVVGADFSFAAHVAPDGAVSCARVPRGRRSLQDAVRRLREQALEPAEHEQRWSVLAQSFLREVVPVELAATLAHAARSLNPAPRLLLLLHGPLESAPLEALDWDALCGVRGVAVATLGGLPAAGLGAQLDASALERWNLLGGPHDAAHGEPLPGAREELAAALAARSQSKLCSGAAFDRAALLAALRSSAPLHLATHLAPLASEQPAANARAERVGFTVSGGSPVTVADVEQARPRMPVAVLSACWSGGGEFVDAEGLLGMSRAFLASGARNVVVTLWPVEDAAAAAFGAAFHRALREQGPQPSVARACASARTTLRALGFERAGWAGFRAVGRD